MFGGEELHGFPRCGVSSDDVTSIKVGVARTEEIALVARAAAAAAAVQTTPLEGRADVVLLPRLGTAAAAAAATATATAAAAAAAAVTMIPLASENVLKKHYLPNS